MTDGVRMITSLNRSLGMEGILSYAGGLEYFPVDSVSHEVHSYVKLGLLSELRIELWVGHCSILGQEVASSVGNGSGWFGII